MSAQSTDKGVNKATNQLFKVASTPEEYIKLGVNGLKNYIKSIGLYNTKAENIIKTCNLLVEQFSSQVPQTRELLERLPGVGRKTANVILNTAYGQHTIAVDTHVFRVATRIGLTKKTSPLSVEMDLLKKIPESYLKNAHHWLILHGRYLCIARKPLCSRCFIKDLCEYPYKTSDV